MKRCAKSKYSGNYSTIKIYTEGEDEEEPVYMSLTQYANIIIASTI